MICHLKPSHTITCHAPGEYVLRLFLLSQPALQPTGSARESEGAIRPVAPDKGHRTRAQLLIGTRETTAMLAVSDRTLLAPTAQGGQGEERRRRGPLGRPPTPPPARPTPPPCDSGRLGRQRCETGPPMASRA
jgi:hypothetical protein